VKRRKKHENLNDAASLQTKEMDAVVSAPGKGWELFLRLPQPWIIEV
jgi:hypothetical protein